MRKDGGECSLPVELHDGASGGLGELRDDVVSGGGGFLRGHGGLDAEGGSDASTATREAATGQDPSRVAQDARHHLGRGGAPVRRAGERAP